jgi:TorA maturation chaperone TorD
VSVAVELVELAGRRARLAALLGGLLLEEPGPDVADLVASVAELEPLGRNDPDLASEFERLFLREVPLFETVFLGADGQRGGPAVAEVVDWYRRHEFDEAARWRVPSPDHLGLELRFLGHLAAREALAWEGDRYDEAARLVEAQQQFFGHHLGQWGEVAIAALLRRTGEGPYAAVASAVGDLLADVAERLRPAPDHPDMPEVVAVAPPRHLGPARIARWLLAPGRAGGFLDVDDLGDAAHSIGVPWRPSDARSQFRQVVEAAIDGGDLDALLFRLRPTVQDWRDAHAQREASRSGDRRVWKRWRLQAERTLSLIDWLSSDGPTGEQSNGDEFRTVVVTVGGRSLDEQAAAATTVIRELSEVGVTISVSAELPPPSRPPCFLTLAHRRCSSSVDRSPRSRCATAERPRIARHAISRTR